jgi:hypothetical protein
VYDHITNIRQTQIALESPHGLHILQPMLCFPQLGVTNPADKFHGYRGLHSAKSPLPEVDLTKSVERVYEEITVWSFGEFGDLFPLTLGLRARISPRLPSWVPDWSARPDIIQGYWRWRNRFYKAYALDNVVGPTFEYVPPGKLLVRGSRMEVVASVSPDVFVKPLGAADHVALLRAWFTFATGRTCLQITDGLFVDSVFCDTMLGGLVRTEQEPFVRKANAEDFSQWRHDVLAMEQLGAAGFFHGLLMESHMTAVLGRALYKSSSGSYGVGPAAIRAGDCLWLWSGARSPCVTRRMPGSQSADLGHFLVGPCYHRSLNRDNITVDEVSHRQDVCTLI